MNTALIVIGTTITVAWIIHLAIKLIKKAGAEPPKRTNTHKLQ